MNKPIIFTDRSNELLVRYLKDISKFKILDADKVSELIPKAQAGDESAKETIIKSNIRFVVTIAKQFQNRGVDLMDLISSGNIGLIKAIDKFDTTRGVTFLSYAVWWIKQEIYNAIYWNGREIRLPMSQQLLIIKIAEATNEFTKNNQRSPSSEEISELTDIPVEQIDYLSQFANKSVSVDDYIGGDDENSQVCDIIPDGEPLLDDVVNSSYVTKELVRILNKLPVREHDLLVMYFGIDMNPVNPQVIANMFNVGPERLRQIKESALSRLRRVYKNQLQPLL